MKIEENSIEPLTIEELLEKMEKMPEIERRIIEVFLRKAGYEIEYV